ncbi:MAG TPA: ribosome maturation factor RimM [Metalysinibacillus jejuensis]|uniref:Ribosome maturation factor RimM n=2 Tax=Bacillales TaxID=1385 RepID=A0A921NC21_9BACL|nr:ribosome maturation factor RimM [Metalysinibacillus jejuensis]HJH10898.1 ribosome maturation factor RimM [Metalysinibacillus jejuensis]
MEWFNVGRIVNTHGVRGEVRILSTTDFEEERFYVGSRLAAFKKGDKKPTWLTIATVRRHKNFILLTFEGIHNINDVLPYKEGLLKITKDQMEEDVLTEHEYYFHEIIGCKVVSEEDGDVIGEIIDILQTGANDVWVVKGAKKEHYIPYIEDVVREINVEDKVITIYVMEGLL